MNVDSEHVKAELAVLLRDKPRGTTADITEHTAIYWDGTRPVGIHLCADPPGFDDRFEVDHHFCGDAHEHLSHWLADPHYSLRPDLVAWLDGSREFKQRD
jgi:hypothetical protein